MKKVLLVSILMSVNMFIFAQLPNKIIVEEYAVSIGTDFKLTNCNGYIDQEIISLTSSFVLSLNGKVYAKSKQQYFSFGSKIDVFDGNNVKIGSFEEQIFESFFSIYSKYIIYDKNGKKVAESIKHEFMTTEFNITDVNNKVICKITRPAINFLSDTWNVEFMNNSFDKRLFIFIPCYKTYKDNQKKK